MLGRYDAAHCPQALLEYEMKVVPTQLTEAVRAGNDVYREFSRDFAALPGFRMAGWRVDHPDEVRVNFVNSGFARLANNVLRDSINGVRLVITSDSTSQDPAADAWADNPSDMARAVAALPGVTRWGREVEHGMTTYGFELNEMAIADHLRALISDRLGEGIVYFWKPGRP